LGAKMVECGTVTHEQCEKYREKLRGEVQGCIFQEREDRKEDQDRLEKGMERLENRMERMNSKLSAVVLELLVGLILGVIAFLLGRT